MIHFFKKVLPYFICLFFVTNLLYAQKTAEFYKDFLEKVESKLLIGNQRYYTDTTAYIHLLAYVDTSYNTKEKIGVVMYDEINAIQLRIYRKITQWELVYKEDSIPLYSYHLQHILIKDFNQDQKPDVLIVGSDGGSRNEQNNLYIAHQQSFTRVKGVENLGYWDGHLQHKGKLYYYAHYSCGCGGDCWVAQLFQIVGTELVFVAKVGCNCNEIEHYQYKKGKAVLVATDKDCETFKGLTFHAKLRSYWESYLAKH